MSYIGVGQYLVGFLTFQAPRCLENASQNKW